MASPQVIKVGSKGAKRWLLGGQYSGLLTFCLISGESAMPTAMHATRFPLLELVEPIITKEFNLNWSHS